MEKVATFPSENKIKRFLHILTKLPNWSCTTYSEIAFKATTCSRNAMKTDSSVDLHFVKEGLCLHL